MANAQFGAIDYAPRQSAANIKSDWANTSMAQPVPDLSSQAALEAARIAALEAARAAAEKWVLLGAGSYNRAYRSQDSREVLKIQKNAAETDTPERSVRLWNLINPDLVPPARLEDSAHGKGWVCPFIV